MSILSRLMGAAQPLPVRVEPQILAAVPTSGVSSPQPWLSDIGWGPRGQSRVKSLPRVTGEIAQRHATVFACCNNIAGDLSKVPLKIYQRDGEGKEQRVRDHPASYLLNVEASPGVPAIIARFSLLYSFTLRGRAYAYAPRDAGGELSMIDLLSILDVQELKNGRARFYDFTDGDGIIRRASTRNMLHLRYMAQDGWTGRSPLEVAGESMGLALAGQESAARAVSGQVSRIVAKIADDFADEAARKRSMDALRRALTDEGGDGVAIVNQGDDIVQLGLSAADQELLQSRKFDREQIAAIYRMPPSKLQMLENGVKANGEQQAIDYKTDCLLHWGKFAEGQLGQSLFTEAERRAGFFLRHDFNTLMQATTGERITAINKAVGGPIWTPNEGRKIDGLDPVAGGDVLNPAPNMTKDTATQKDT